eukprot:7293126-Pyramimonas_sp.AAC.1
MRGLCLLAEGAKALVEQRNGGPHGNSRHLEQSGKPLGHGRPWTLEPWGPRTTCNSSTLLTQIA